MVRLSLDCTAFFLFSLPIVSLSSSLPAKRSNPVLGATQVWIASSLTLLAMTTELDVQHAAVGVEHGFLHHLRQGRMREYRVHQLFLGRLEVHGDDIALDQLGNLGADHVRAEQLPGLLVEDHLDQALVLAERDRLAVADEREAANPDLTATLLRLGLSEANGG